MNKIGDVAKQLNISIDTLRYYEKIHLLGTIKRNNSGIRLYSDEDLAKVRFIKHAQKMGFSLDDIRQLLRFREAPQQAKPQVRAIVVEKLALIEQQMAELSQLRDELSQLVAECQSSSGDCPILEKFAEK